MSISSRKVLLTGGAGFIGSHLCEALLSRSEKLTIVDNLDAFYSESWKKANLDEVRRRGSFQFENADIRDVHRMTAIFERTRPEVVIHLAARVGVRPSLEQPRLYVDVNVDGTCNVLELSRQTGVLRFIFASSSSVYGTASQVPFRESATGLRPVSPYAATKLAGETLCYT